jgi:hypothetical protein
MNLHRWLGALFVLSALAGCAQSATEPGQAPYGPIRLATTGNIHATGVVMVAAEAVEGAVCSGQGNQI